MQAFTPNLVRVEYINGFYFAIAETFNYSAEVLRDVIGASSFPASEFKKTEQQLVERGYQIVSEN